MKPSQLSAFAASNEDLPLFSQTAPAAHLETYAPAEQPQQPAMFDRREYIQAPAKPASLAPETNTELLQLAADDDPQPVDPIKAQLRTLVLSAWGGFTIYDLSGDRNAKRRQRIMEVITGQKLPQSKCGVTVIESHLVRLAHAENAGCPAAQYEAIYNWLAAD